MLNMGPKQKKWSQEVTKQLVSLYELQPVLYKVSLPEYHNKTLRLKAYETIKVELENTFKENFEVEEITKKINNLRTQFLEVEKNRRKIIPSGSGAESKIVPSWWLYNELLFLLPHCKRDKGMSNLQMNLESSCRTEGEATDEETASTSDWGRIIEEVEFDGRNVGNVEAEVIVQPSPSLLSPTTLTDSEQNWTPTPRQRGMNKRKRVENEIDEAIVKAIEQVSSSPEKYSIPEDIRIFCDFAGNELSSIKNPKILKECKWQIQTIIHQKQEEEQNLANQ